MTGEETDAQVRGRFRDAMDGALEAEAERRGLRRGIGPARRGSEEGKARIRRDLYFRIALRAWEQITRRRLEP